MAHIHLFSHRWNYSPYLTPLLLLHSFLPAFYDHFLVNYLIHASYQSMTKQEKGVGLMKLYPQWATVNF